MPRLAGGAPASPGDVVSEKSRLRFACRRGTLELDLVLQRYLASSYPQASPQARSAFEELLKLQDPQLIDFIFNGQEPQNADLSDVVRQLRQYG